MREDLIQEGITRILELTGKTTDANYLMESAKNAMRSYLASHKALRFSGTFEPYDDSLDSDLHFHGKFGGDPAKIFENMSFSEMGTFRTPEPNTGQDTVRAWSAM